MEQWNYMSQLKHGFQVAISATAHVQHTCDGFGGQRAFWSFLDLFGPFCSVLGHRFAVIRIKKFNLDLNRFNLYLNLSANI
jgi:hypothetical protein